MALPDTPVVFFKGLQENAPVYATAHAAGADIKAFLDSPCVLKPGERVLIPTGLRLAIPLGWEGQLRPRSGLALEKGITLLNTPGTIDADYRGELKIILINLGNKSTEIKPKERIAQLVIRPVATVCFKKIEELPASKRGEAGFGSTGR